MSKYILVDAISMFRMRYAISVPNDVADDVAVTWAEDCVIGENDITEFSQHHIDEVISSCRVMNKEDLLNQFVMDNDYVKSWTEEQKLKCVMVLDGKGRIRKQKEN